MKLSLSCVCLLFVLCHHYETAHSFTTRVPTSALLSNSPFLKTTTTETTSISTTPDASLIPYTRRSSSSSSSSNTRLSLGRRFEDASTRHNTRKANTNTKNNNNNVLKFDIDMIKTSGPLLTTQTATSNNNNNDNGNLRHLLQTSKTLRNCLITPLPSPDSSPGRQHEHHHDQVQEFVLSRADRNELRKRILEQDNDISIDTDDDSSIVGLRFTTGAVQFPGLTIESVCKCAVVPLVRNNHENENDVLAGYEFIVLDVQNRPRGRKPMVWLYNKIVSAAPLQTMSRTRVTWRGCFDDSNNNNLQLHYHSRAQVQVPLPRMLVRALPLNSLDSTNGMGSQALQSAVQAEIQDCIKASQAWLDYELQISETQQQQQQQESSAQQPQRQTVKAARW